jgi:hypothetical protein
VPRIAYPPHDGHRFTPKTLRIIELANEICADYRTQGYDLTLRQLYYQFVARDLIENSDRSYKNLGNTVNMARLAGLLDWRYIVDRTRNLRDQAHWNTPEQIVDAVAQQYRTDRWANQPTYVEVWVEKDALIGVIASACEPLDVPYFSCRGYTSQSEVWGAAQRLIRRNNRGQKAVIIHLGDHDPSGIDMSRDIADRFETFGADATVKRIALNRDQVDQYRPPPNPAKLTDARAQGYIARHGRYSWELDALNPTTLGALINGTVLEHRDEAQWNADTAAMEQQRAVLAQISARFADVEDFLTEDDESE